MMILLLLLPILGWPQRPIHWSNLAEVKERHEFYQNNEVITKPEGSWQTLLAVVYIDRNLGRHKDCVYYRVPSAESLGVLKIKSLPDAELCETQVESPGDREVTGIKAFQFGQSMSRLNFHFTYPDFRSSDWEFPIAQVFSRPEAKLLMSSAEYRSPKYIFLAPARGEAQKFKFKKEHEICHAVAEDCKEKSPSSCNECAYGWYEVPNSCLSGPKYCASIDSACGGRSQPACRRGMKWQRKEGKFDCRVDSSFAYCSPGRVIQCQGNEAYCR